MPKLKRGPPGTGRQPDDKKQKNQKKNIIDAAFQADPI
jgi:hypothetical protein